MAQKPQNTINGLRGSLPVRDNADLTGTYSFYYCYFFFHAHVYIHCIRYFINSITICSLSLFLSLCIFHCRAEARAICMSTPCKRGVGLRLVYSTGRPLQTIQVNIYKGVYTHSYVLYYSCTYREQVVTNVHTEWFQLTGRYTR